MFGRRPLHMGALVMILILALATVGVGYGLWSKVLVIDGMVETGKVEIVFSSDEIDEGELGAGDERPIFWEGDSDCDEDTLQNDDCEVELKDIAECTAELINNDMGMEITITKGYPSYNCWVQFDVHNTGTIPVRLHQPLITPLNFTNGLEVTVRLEDGFHGPAGRTFPETSSICYHGVGVWNLDERPPELLPWWGATGPAEHPQLEPGGTVYCIIHVHVEQPAAQGLEGDFAYKFKAEVCAHQWNEEPASVKECIAAAP